MGADHANAEFGQGPVIVLTTGNLPFGLDVWDRDKGGKVFNMEWDNEGHFNIMNFTRGPWEERALKLALY